ncbi:MAG: hypothetical protein JSR89_06830 [Proteobacteria bacterium]|nr:hypothetical protein [Pseudomonadota bacterium]
MIHSPSISADADVASIISNLIDAINATAWVPYFISKEDEENVKEAVDRAEIWLAENKP